MAMTPGQDYWAGGTRDVTLRGIEPSKSCWHSYPHRTQNRQECEVLHQLLDAVSKFNAYPMPKVGDLVGKLGGSTFLSTIDLTKGYQ